MGKSKYIETPEKMWELFVEYAQKTKARKRIIQKATPRGTVNEEHTPPLTMEGFENYCEDNVGCVHQYFANQDNAYTAYLSICSRIRREIRQDQIEGGMIGQYNPSITQRLNGLTDKQDITTNGENISEINVNIRRKGLAEE